MAPLARNAIVTFDSPTGQRPFSAEVRAGASTFSTRAAAGRYIIRASMLGPVSDAGALQSATLDGKDITDRAFDLVADTTS